MPGVRPHHGRADRGKLASRRKNKEPDIAPHELDCVRGNVVLPYILRRLVVTVDPDNVETLQ